MLRDVAYYQRRQVTAEYNAAVEARATLLGEVDGWRCYVHDDVLVVTDTRRRVRMDAYVSPRDYKKLRAVAQTLIMLTMARREETE